MFYYSRYRKGEHPQAHLARYDGILCQSASKFDPPYCLICECYQGGGDATLSDAQVDVWVTGGPVGGSGPS